jgi:hypothetical protein
MPKEFMDCVKNGGRVFTVGMGKDKYMHGCQPKGGGKAVYGEMKKKMKKEMDGKMKK